MKTVYSVLSKGKELEFTYTTRLQAEAAIYFADLYMPTIEPEQYTDAEFEELVLDELESFTSCLEWGESTEVERYQTEMSCDCQFNQSITEGIG